METRCRNIREAIASARAQTNHVQECLVQAFARAEDATSLLAERNDPQHRLLLQKRPLDPESARLRERISTLLYVVNTLQTDVHEELESRAVAATGRPQVPRHKQLCDAINDNRRTARKIKAQVNMLAEKMDHMGLGGM